MAGEKAPGNRNKKYDGLRSVSPNNRGMHHYDHAIANATRI